MHISIHTLAAPQMVSSKIHSVYM